MRRLPCVCLGCGAVLLASVATSAQVPVIPIAGDTPNVVIGLTNQEHPDDLEFEPVNSSTLTGTLPLGGSPYYHIATYDTGAPVHIISREAYLGFGIGAAGLNGAYPTGVGGGGGPVIEAIASDPLGVYLAGLGDVTGTSPTLAINTSQLKGQYNTSILYAQAGDVLPSVIGTPLSSKYTTVIDYGNPQIFDYNGTTYRSPQLSLHAFGSLPQPVNRIGLTLYPGPFGPPAFFPSLDNFNDFHDNPATPTVGGTFFMQTNLYNDGNERENVEMILDTGAQGSIVSESFAASLGFHVDTDAPDFVVRIAGVTGIAEEVPGFFADQMTFSHSGGTLTLTNVPLIVYNLTDPRDGSNVLDGLIGMNLFSDRTLTLNPQDGNPYLAVSAPALQTHTWNASGTNGAWGTTTNWSAAGTPALTWIAQVVNPAGSARNANVNANSSVNYLYVKGNAANMDVRIANNVRLTVFGSAILETDGYVTLLTSSSALDAQTVELRGGTIRGNGTVLGEVISQGTVSPGASAATAGTLTFDGSFDQLLQGTLDIDIGGATPGTQHDRVIVTGLVSIGGTLDISLINGFNPVHGNTFTIFTAQDITGEFDFVLGDSLGGIALAILYNPTSIILQAVELLAGDANNDGIVDAADFLAIEQQFGQTGTTSGVLWGDANDDGRVDGDDWVWAEQHLGSTLGSPAPQPGALALVIVGVGVVIARRVRLSAAQRRRAA